MYKQVRFKLSPLVVLNYTNPNIFYPMHYLFVYQFVRSTETGGNIKGERSTTALYIASHARLKHLFDVSIIIIYSFCNL